ncbi:hypothetical protein F2P79_005922 [Pimephales promelas]|nr:hypothetical protein F2P79_005922 [Pimephales promelas]
MAIPAPEKERERERIKEQVKEEYNAFLTFAELNREYFTRANGSFSDFSILNHPCVLFKYGCFSVDIYNVKKRRVEGLYVLFWKMQRGA